jgi:hypothetical protein
MKLLIKSHYLNSLTKITYDHLAFSFDKNIYEEYYLQKKLKNDGKMCDITWAEPTIVKALRTNYYILNQVTVWR